MLFGKRIHEFGDRLATLYHLRDDADGGIDGVIKPQIIVGDEDMARHFSGKRGLELLHPLLHMTMASLPDLRGGACALDEPQCRFRGFHVQQDRRARMPCGDILCQKRGQQVARHLPALAIDNADSVAVTVETDAEIGAGRRDLGPQQLECFRVDRVRMVVREGPVNFREQHLVRAVETRHQLFGRRPAGPVAAIPDDREACCDGAGGKPVDIGLLDGPRYDASVIGAIGSGGADAAKLLDIRAEEGQAAHHHLEAVMRWRVVASGHLNGAATAKLVGSEIQHRRRTAADIGYLRTTGDKPVDQRCGKHR